MNVPDKVSDKWLTEIDKSKTEGDAIKTLLWGMKRVQDALVDCVNELEARDEAASERRGEMQREIDELGKQVDGTAFYVAKTEDWSPMRGKVIRLDPADKPKEEEHVCWIAGCEKPTKSWFQVPGKEKTWCCDKHWVESERAGDTIAGRTATPSSPVVKAEDEVQSCNNCKAWMDTGNGGNCLESAFRKDEKMEARTARNNWCKHWKPKQQERKCADVTESETPSQQQDKPSASTHNLTGKHETSTNTLTDESICGDCKDCAASATYVGCHSCNDKSRFTPKKPVRKTPQENLTCGECDNPRCGCRGNEMKDSCLALDVFTPKKVTKDNAGDKVCYQAEPEKGTIVSELSTEEITCGDCIGNEKNGGDCNDYPDADADGRACFVRFTPKKPPTATGGVQR